VINVTLADVDKFDIKTFSIGINGCARQLGLRFLVRYGARTFGTNINDMITYSFPWARKESKNNIYYSLGLNSYFKNYAEILDKWVEVGKSHFQEDLENYLKAESEELLASETKIEPTEVAC
jgi:hypothetical protein